MRYHFVVESVVQPRKDSLGHINKKLLDLLQGQLTRGVVGELQRRCTLLHIYIEYVVVFFTIIELFTARANGINDFADLLPARRDSVPLSSQVRLVKVCQLNMVHLVRFYSIPDSNHLYFSGFFSWFRSSVH